MSKVSEPQVIDLYRGSVQRLFGNVCRQAAGDRALAEDVVQETWLRAVETWRSHGLPRNPEAWLHRVARNLLVSHYRRAKREIPAGSGLCAGASAPGDPAEAVALEQSLDGLAPENAALVRGFHLHGRTTTELAADTGLSERAVEGRLRRARIALAGWLRNNPTRQESNDG